MDPLYSTACSIVERTQPNLDGGLLAFALNNIITLPGEHKNDTTTFAPHKISDHVRLTLARTGYAISVAFGTIWIILLLLAAIFVCRKRRRRKNRTDKLIYVIEATPNGNDTITRFVRVDSQAKCGKLLQRKRDQMQSYWLYSAIQFFAFAILVLLLGTGVMLGFTVSSQLHANVATAPSHEEAVGRLLRSPELEHTNPPRTYVFPRVLRALAQVRAYLSEFVYYTKNHTAPIVDDLINATEAMQDRITIEFNDILFKKIGVAEAFELGDSLGSSVISLIQHSVAVEKQDTVFKNHFDQFKLELRAWLRLIDNNSPPADDHLCKNSCATLRSLFVANLTSRPDSFMPPFPFAVALKFLMESQNQTAETIRQQLTHGKVLADRQLMETKQIMAERINIPQSIRNMTNKQWDMLSTQLSEPIRSIDRTATLLLRNVIPKVASWSLVVLALGCILWILLLFMTLGVSWLVVYHHCVPSALHSGDRRRVRCAAAIGLVLLAISMCSAMSLFLLGGYVHTEGCRYLNPNQKSITVIDHDVVDDTYRKQHMFPLDSHINSFIDKNWETIKLLASSMNHGDSKQPPIPRIRSPIFAITHNCRKNVGILEAMDAIRSFDMASLNDPQVSDRFVDIGREIMIDSLKAIDVNEMFPKETDDQLAMAGRLDDFIVDFEKIRSALPTTYLSTQLGDDESDSYVPFSEEAMWSSWDVYYSTVLESRMSEEQSNKLKRATDQVRMRMLSMTSAVHEIDNHLKELSKAKKISPVVDRLQEVVKKLKSLMSDKPTLVEIASRLFNETIAPRTPDQAKQLIAKFGPKLMGEVGRCHRLYEAARDVNSALCDGVVGVLNGLWFVLGWVVLMGSLITGFGLVFLLHKSADAHSIKQGTWRFGRSNRRHLSLNGTATSGILANQSELESLNRPDQYATLTVRGAESQANPVP